MIQKKQHDTTHIYVYDKEYLNKLLGFYCRY